MLAAGVTMLACGAARAAEAPVAEQPSADPAAAGDVVITARPPEITDRIDRRIYDVESDPIAQVGLATDVLRKLPSVTVSPEGAVALRGDYGVSILIDGKPASAGALSQLPANQVARVEVITNPSAQFAPDGTSGVINVVLRKRHPVGISGQGAVSADTHGSLTADLTSNLNSGRWNFSGGATLGYYLKTSKSRSALTLYDAGGVVEDEIVVRSRSNQDWRLSQANAALSFKVSPEFTIGLSGRASHSEIGTRARDSSAGLMPLDNYAQKTRSDLSSRDGSVTASLDYASADGLQELSATAMRRGVNRTTVQQFDNTYASPALTPTLTQGRNESDDDTSLVSAEYTRRLAGGRLLTLGASWRRDESRSLKTLTTNDPLVSGYNELFSGSEARTDLYGTYQFSLGNWKVLPGLRLQSVVRRFDSSPGLASVREVDAFPSLHLSRNLSDHGKLKLSYSRRIDRNGLQDYDPTITFRGTRAAFSGNPSLKPQIVDSYEVSYLFDRREFGFVVAGYFRDKNNNVEAVAQDLGSGVVLYRRENTSGSRTAGFEFTIHGDFGGGRWSHLRYSVNTNVFVAEIPRLSGGAAPRRRETSWSGNAMLEYIETLDGGDGDRLQLSLDAAGPRKSAQGSDSGYAQLDLTYLHPLDERWSLSVTVSDITNSAGGWSSFSAPGLYRRADRESSNQGAKVSLTRKF